MEFFVRLSFRSTRLLALALVAATVPVAACAGAGNAAALASTTPNATPSGATPRAGAAPEIPDSPAGRQLRWILDAVGRTPLAESELKEHINAAYLALVTVDGANTFLKDLAGLELKELTEVTATSLAGAGTLSDKTVLFRLRVDKDGRIDQFDAVPPPPPIPATPASWAELDQRLRKVAPEVGFLAAEINSRGRCEIVHAVAPDKTQPLGSIFKLYVLGAVAEKIRNGELSWNTKLRIKPEWKSPGEGGLVDQPDNSTVTVREAAKLMISISDNTATDILIHTVGRKTVEAKVRQWSDHANLNIPFLTTRELFLLKGANYPQQAKTYLALDTAGKRAYLKNTVAKQSPSDIVGWNKPREIGALEWFGSPRDICRAYAGLTRLKSKPLHEALSANDIGLELDPKKWPTVWAKGGSELGVLDLSYFARTAKGKTYVVTALSNNPEAGLDERTLAPELISLSRGAFSLVKTN